MVTGQGVVSSLGHNPDEFYMNLLAGKSGISMIDGWDTGGGCCWADWGAAQQGNLVVPIARLCAGMQSFLSDGPACMMRHALDTAVVKLPACRGCCRGLQHSFCGADQEPGLRGVCGAEVGEAN